MAFAVATARQSAVWARRAGQEAYLGVDIGEWMVSQGWAVAYYLYSYEYSRTEQRARSARRGIWAGDFEKPWEWRKQQRKRR